MKLLRTCILILATWPMVVRGENPEKAAADKAYSEFLAQLTKTEHLAEFAEKSDHLIDAGEKAQEEAGVGRNAVSTDTKVGLHLEFAVIRTPEVILYYASLSRNGEMLRYTDAATLLALFCDRAGLTHPVDIKEGERPVFHAQWLIKPSEWKALRKKMLEVRAYNRGEKDVLKALRTAVNTEVAARMASKAVK